MATQMYSLGGFLCLRYFNCSNGNRIHNWCARTGRVIVTAATEAIELNNASPSVNTSVVRVVSRPRRTSIEQRASLRVLKHWFRRTACPRDLANTADVTSSPARI